MVMYFSAIFFKYCIKIGHLHIKVNDIKPKAVIVLIN